MWTTNSRRARLEVDSAVENPPSPYVVRQYPPRSDGYLRVHQPSTRGEMMEHSLRHHDAIDRSFIGHLSVDGTKTQALDDFQHETSLQGYHFASCGIRTRISLSITTTSTNHCPTITTYTHYSIAPSQLPHDPLSTQNHSTQSPSRCPRRLLHRHLPYARHSPLHFQELWSRPHGRTGLGAAFGRRTQRAPAT